MRKEILRFIHCENYTHPLSTGCKIALSAKSYGTEERSSYKGSKKVRDIYIKTWQFSENPWQMHR
jgi:hypothetical protein